MSKKLYNFSEHYGRNMLPESKVYHVYGTVKLKSEGTSFEESLLGELGFTQKGEKVWSAQNNNVSYMLNGDLYSGLVKLQESASDFVVHTKIGDNKGNDVTVMFAYSDKGEGSYTVIFANAQEVPLEKEKNVFQKLVSRFKKEDFAEGAGMGVIAGIMGD